MIRIRPLFALFISSVLFAAPGGAEGSPEVVQTRVKRVALFKNGYGFFSCEGRLPRSAQRIDLDRVPRAVLGTLWFGTSGGTARVVDARVVKRTTLLQRPAMDFEELIRSNPGKRVSVKTDQEILGRLLPVPGTFHYPDSTFFAPAGTGRNPYAGFRRGADVSAEGAGGSVRPGVFLVQGEDGGTSALRFSDVRELKIDGDCCLDFQEEIEKPFLECSLDHPSEGGSLDLHYLQGGASWIPAYEIELVDAEEAVVRLKGTLVNDVEDLEEVEVRFVVGYPNFMYSYLEEPLSGWQTLQEFLRALAAGPPSDSRQGAAMMVQQSLTNVAYFDRGGGHFAMPVLPEGGEFKEDLFCYPPVTATVDKGERLSFVISQDKVPYRHVYTWEIPDTIPLDPRGYYQKGPREPLPDDVLWHSLQLDNQSERPWTTASALIVQDEVPLGQDLLRYTSVGRETLVRITRATDVAGSKKEFEIERQHNSKVMYGDQYDQVTVRGELLLQNKRSEPVHAVVTKKTTGTVRETASEAVVEVRAEGLNPVNQNSTLKWEVDLKPGEEKSLTYVIEVHVRA